MLPLLRRAAEGDPVIVAPVGDELERAVALALGPQGRSAPLGAARSLLDSSAMAGGTGADDIRAVRAGRTLRYAVVPVRSPGRTAMLLMNGRLPRGVSPADELAIAGAIDAACGAQAAAGVRLAQALVPDAQGPLARLLRDRCGFETLADLLYLQRRARTRAAVMPLPPGITLATYGPRTHDAFAEAIEASYAGSLDCPKLAGVRHIEDVIAGHKAAGLFRPDWWTLALDAGRPIGVLLLAGLGIGGHMGAEVVYLGLAPAARGRGLSAPLLAWAERAAATTPGRLMALAVDAANTPALRIYRRAGFRQNERRTALIRRL